MEYIKSHKYKHEAPRSYFSWLLAPCPVVSFALLLGLVSVVFSVLALEAQAQEAAGLKVQPAIIEERVDPGQVLSLILRATNLSGETQTYNLVTRNISGLSAIGTPIFAGEEEETGFEMSSWVTIPQASVVISSGQTKEIPFSIEVPQDAAPGGHYGGIFLTRAGERPEGTDVGIGVGYEVGTIINLRISGEIFEEAQIREFRTDRAIYSKPEVAFITKIANIGNVLVRPRGPLEITDSFGKKVATITVNDSAGGILPNQTRQFETLWKGEGFAAGRYQVVMGLVYGEEGRKTISSVLSFWVLPTNIILPIGGGILGFILAVFILVKFYISRKLRQLQELGEGRSRQGRFRNVERELLRSKKSAPLSRLALFTVTMLIFTMLFLAVLFFFFA